MDFDKTTTRKRLSLNWRRELPIIGTILALFILLYAGVEFGPLTAMRRAVSNPAYLFLRNPALVLTPEEAALELVPGKLRMSGLARLLDASTSDPLAAAFQEEFMKRPPLRDAVKNHLATKNGAALHKALVKEPAFAELFAKFYKIEAFQSTVARLGRLDRDSAGAAAKPSTESSSPRSFFSMIRGGKDLKDLSQKMSESPGLPAGSAAEAGGVPHGAPETKGPDAGVTPYNWPSTKRSDMPGVAPVPEPVAVNLQRTRPITPGFPPPPPTGGVQPPPPAGDSGTAGDSGSTPGDSGSTPGDSGSSNAGGDSGTAGDSGDSGG